jgi:signal recognition particle GTPase
MSLFKKLLAKITGTNVSAGELQDLETILIEADLGSSVTKKIIDAAKSRKDDNFLDSVKATLTDSLSTKSRNIAFDAQQPTVLLIVGVNGTGKTTSAAKLANYLKNENKKVLMAAATKQEFATKFSGRYAPETTRL